LGSKLGYNQTVQDCKGLFLRDKQGKYKSVDKYQTTRDQQRGRTYLCEGGWGKDRIHPATTKSRRIRLHVQSTEPGAYDPLVILQYPIQSIPIQSAFNITNRQPDSGLYNRRRGARRCVGERLYPAFSILLCGQLYEAGRYSAVCR